MLTREEILNKAYHDCMAEMYAKSQPEADYDNLLEEYRSGKIGNDERIYERHYLSQDEFLYIRDKYKSAYGIQSHWKDDVEVIEKYLEEGGHKDKYIPERTDEDGFKHPGYRGYENVKPIRDQIFNALSEDVSSGRRSQLADYLTKIVMETIKDCKNYHKFDREEDNFDCSIALGASPTSNSESVKKWWKENYNKDIEIEERNPKLFWYRDNGYTDEDLEYEFDSPNWKEIVDKEWEEEKAKRKRKLEEAEVALEEARKKYNEENGQEE